MGLIFDSCIWIGLATGQVEREAVVAAAGEAPVFTSVISLGELRFGVETCADPAERAVRAVRAAYLRQMESRPWLFPRTPQRLLVYTQLPSSRLAGRHDRTITICG